MNTVNTPHGEVRLLQPPDELLNDMRAMLPFGMIRYPEPRDGAGYGIVMQCGDREAYGVKLQPMPCDEELGLLFFQANSILAAHSLAGYLRNGFSGLFMPCAYIRRRDGDDVESGIAFIGASSPCGRECLEVTEEGACDHPFGRGFTAMMLGFIDALKQSSLEIGFPLPRAIGLDVRPHSLLGSPYFGFMVLGPHVACLKTHIAEEDPVWAAIRSTGVSEVFHIPSVAALIAESELHLAKPSA